MSTSIYYQPVKGRYLNVAAPSSFMEALRQAFGNEPWTLTDGDYYTLKGLAAKLESLDQRIAAEDLAEAVKQNGEIRIWAEY